MTVSSPIQRAQIIPSGSLELPKVSSPVIQKSITPIQTIPIPTQAGPVPTQAGGMPDQAGAVPVQAARTGSFSVAEQVDKRVLIRMGSSDKDLTKSPKVRASMPEKQIKKEKLDAEDKKKRRSLFNSNNFIVTCN
jgi:hypothetical protein